MSMFAVHYTYADDPRVDEVRPAHRAYLATLVADGRLAASGPYLDVTPAQALLLFRAETAADVQEWLRDDPFQQAQLVAATRITAWNPVLGVFAG